MRSFLLLLVVLAAFLTCSSAVTATSVRSSKTFNNRENTYTRALRSETKTEISTEEDDDSEERIVPPAPSWLTKFRIWKLKREGVFHMAKTPKQLAKEVAQAEKGLVKEQKQYIQWLKAKQTPSEIFLKLGLASLGTAAMQSSNFRRYEEYVKLFDQHGQSGGKGASWIRKWLVNYKLGKLKTKATVEMRKADEQLAREKEEYSRWVLAGLTPDYLFQKLGLAKLGDKAVENLNYRRWEAYSKLWEDSTKLKVKPPTS